MVLFHSKSSSVNFKFYSTVATAYALILLIMSILFTVDGANILVPVMMEKYSVDRTAASLPYTIGAYIGIFTAYFLGGTIKKLGIKKVLLPVIAIAGVLWFFVVRADSYVAYCVFTALMISCLNLINFVPGALISSWFRKHRGQVLGILVCGGPFTTAIVVPGVSSLVNTYGYLATYTAIGAIMIAFCVLCAFLLVDTPAKVGCEVDNGKIFAVGNVVEKTTSPIIPFRKFILSPLFWLNFFGWNLLNICNTGVMSNIMNIAKSLGFESLQVTHIQMIGGLIAIPVNIFWGYIDDKIGPQKASRIAAVVYFLFAGSMFLGASQSIAGYALMTCVCVGMCCTLGTPRHLQPSLLTWSFGGENFVEVQRYFVIGMAFSKGTSIFIMSSVYDKFGSYANGFIILMILSAISFICFMLMRRPYPGVAMQGFGKIAEKSPK